MLDLSLPKGPVIFDSADVIFKMTPRTFSFPVSTANGSYRLGVSMSNCIVAMVYLAVEFRARGHI